MDFAKSGLDGLEPKKDLNPRVSTEPACMRSKPDSPVYVRDAHGPEKIRDTITDISISVRRV